MGYADDVTIATHIGHTIVPTTVALQNAEWVLKTVTRIKYYLREYMNLYPAYITNETVILTI